MLLRQRNQEKICLFRGVGGEGRFVYGGLGEGMFIYEGRGRKYVCLWGSGEKVYIHYNVMRVGGAGGDGEGVNGRVGYEV